MAKPSGGLKAWFGKGPKGDWVDIGAPKKKGKYQPCGRKSAKKSKRAYPKCVPRSKAASMTKAQIKAQYQENDQKLKELEVNQQTLKLLLKRKRKK